MQEGKKMNRQQVHYAGKLMRHWYWCVLMLLFLAGLSILVFYINSLAGTIVIIFSVVLYAILILLDLYYRPRVLQELVQFAQEYNHVQKELLDEFSIPYGLMEPDGRLLWMNRQLSQMVGRDSYYHKSIQTVFPEFDMEALPEQEEETLQEFKDGEQVFRVIMRRVHMDALVDQTEVASRLKDGTSMIALNFFDITELARYRTENVEQRQAVGLLYIDNYDEAMESVEDVRRSMLSALVERSITKYAASADGICKKLEKDKYLLVMDRKNFDRLRQEKFSILETVKTVNIGNSIRVTVSLGFGLENGGFAQDGEAARSAMEMALARGGDQAVVKIGDQIQFFGGKTEHEERNTMVRARVKAQALREIILTRDRVLVMGHRITDIDSFGASVGVCRAAMQAGKKAHIVLGDINSSIRSWVALLRDTGEYGNDFFVNHEQAVELNRTGTIVVVVDTNRPSMVECEEILKAADTVVVLDHHRQTAERIERAALSYIEPSASSACEMVAEILQYFDVNIQLRPHEADCMYAGIVIDTNNFVAKTGSRTFEAAAFLRKYGADVTRVRKAFRNDMDTYKARAEAVRHAELFMGRYAISVCPAEGLENPTVVGAQAANELLNIIGVKASFVLTEFEKRIYISARAIDEVNVQLIMERLGGGGHMNIAGAQLSGVTVEEAKDQLKELLQTMTGDGDL